ncbi:MAG: proline/glycine betaine ABC transporter permease [Trueperaceae bacterium]|jgi:glycine betaine/proline transport system permease protein|nr:proline/glycine betaine ABC transporter permease [Truepera sp.]HRN17972.1 proline/glycine betaine ABC transporter permease [Trueperaceae bacterium]HRQ09578.1 proline/glycine betaine ABC transporter permease [Trueperaceae bacterium]
MGNLLFGSFPEGWRIPLRKWTNTFVDWLVANYGDFFRSITDSLLYVLVQVERFLNWLPWWSVVLLVGLLVWHASGKRVAPAIVLAGLLALVGTFDLWPQMVTTLAIMIVATTATVAIGIPIGIAMARSDRLKRVLQPLLDGMQTMPSFVYLVPVVMFFGLGNVAAIFATFVYAVPPVIRLTDLGLRLVDEEVVEAADSFGASERQLLWWVRIPLAVPTIMAGINQTIMMALAMVVVASMIGARGLGQEVLRSLQRGDVGLGLEAGLAIVILAIVMDRVTAGYGRRMDNTEQAG